MAELQCQNISMIRQKIMNVPLKGSLDEYHFARIAVVMRDLALFTCNVYLAWLSWQSCSWVCRAEPPQSALYSSPRGALPHLMLHLPDTVYMHATITANSLHKATQISCCCNLSHLCQFPSNDFISMAYICMQGCLLAYGNFEGLQYVLPSYKVRLWLLQNSAVSYFREFLGMCFEARPRWHCWFTQKHSC